MSNILRGQDSIDIIKPIAEPYEDDYVNNDTQEISEIDKQEEQENHNEFEIKRGAEAIALIGIMGITDKQVEETHGLKAFASCKCKGSCGSGCSGHCSGCGGACNHNCSGCTGGCQGCKGCGHGCSSSC